MLANGQSGRCIHIEAGQVGAQHLSGEMPPEHGRRLAVATSAIGEYARGRICSAIVRPSNDSNRARSSPRGQLLLQHILPAQVSSACSVPTRIWCSDSGARALKAKLPAACVLTARLPLPAIPPSQQQNSVRTTWRVRCSSAFGQFCWTVMAFQAASRRSQQTLILVGYC